MDLAVVLRHLDAEIEKLNRVRAIIAALGHPRRIRRSKPVASPLPAVVEAVAPVAPSPAAIVVPPRRKREYRSRLRHVEKQPVALAAAPSSRPVFVPRAAAVAAEPPSPETNPELLEAALRHNLLGGAA